MSAVAVNGRGNEAGGAAGQMAAAEFAAGSAAGSAAEAAARMAMGMSDGAQQQAIDPRDLDRLRTLQGDAFEAGFSRLVQQVESDLLQQDSWLDAGVSEAHKSMRRLRAELLGLLHHAQARSFSGDHGLARKLLLLLPGWLSDAGQMYRA